MESSNILQNYKDKYANIHFIISEFDKPIFLNKFYINRNSLISNANKVQFSKNIWRQNPQRFALDYYNEYEYYRIVLLVNNIGSILLFNENKLINNNIICPTQNDILQLIY